MFLENCVSGLFSHWVTEMLDLIFDASWEKASERSGRALLKFEDDVDQRPVRPQQLFILE